MHLSQGSLVWKFDDNHRVYLPGKIAPDYRSMWVKHHIEAETSRSWILSDGTKIDKKTLGRAGDSIQYRFLAYSEEEVDQHAWVKEHRQTISSEVGRLHNYYTLQNVARIIGYERV